ncbi:hypothetical protein DENSPDRAFT_873011 [Dentipellis sp. KUC8613]|nr:hypothetical protein DENSPDRAFT_873011 [Dentipellis sp. KUC8613]
MDNLQEGVSIQDFVLHVYGFDCANLRLGSWQYSHREDLWKEYISCATEPGRYKPFCGLFEDAYAQLSDHTELPKHCNLKLRPLGSTQVLGDHNYRKPDVVVVGEGVEPCESGDRLLFKEIPLCMEFKKDSKPSQRQLDEVNRLQSGGFKSEPVNALRTKRKLDSGVEEGRKRARVTTQTGDEAQIKGKQLTADEQQLARYALESFSTVGNRRYVTGIFVKDLTLSLWYFDRIGAIKSDDLHFLSEPGLFMLIVAAIYSCDSEHLGYEPLLQHPDRGGWPFSSVKDSTLTLPFYSTSDSPEVKTPVAFDVTDEALHVQYGIVGRGTVVLPVRLSPGARCKGVKASREYVAKFSWPVSSRIKEDESIWKIRNSIEEDWRRYIPDLKLSLTIEDGNKLAFLPREVLKSLNGPPPELRVLRILVLPKYERLRDVKSLTEFKEVFIGLLWVHHIVNFKAKILHRDLSTENLMFNRDKKKHAYGILNDWDLCEDADTKTHTTTARHRTGTLPFMAMELLCEKPPVHRYRHDLESFFWILIWAVFHFELNGEERPSNDLVNSWMHGTWKDMALAKRDFLEGGEELADDLLLKVTPAFQPLIKIWVMPLRAMFMKYHSAWTAHTARKFQKRMNNARLNVVNEVVRRDREYDDDSSDDEDDSSMGGKRDERTVVGDDIEARGGLDDRIENQVTSQPEAEGGGEREDSGKVENQDDDLLDEVPWKEETANDTVTFAKFLEAIGQPTDP